MRAAHRQRDGDAHRAPPRGARGGGVALPGLNSVQRAPVRYQTLRSGRFEYLTNFDTKPPGSGDSFHVLAGGRRGRFSLTSTAGRWPVDAGLSRDLGLVGAGAPTPRRRRVAQRPVRLKLLRRARVARHPALLLKVAHYPDGGVHGGHLAVVWNQGRDGYVLSLHFAEHSPRARAEQEAVLLRAATTMSRFGGGHDS